jgi:hypothetical protein
MNNELKQKLDDRLVKGEISTEEYDKILNTLSDNSANEENTQTSSKDNKISSEGIDKSQQSTEQNHTHTSEANTASFWAQLRKGELGLARTYWLYGVVVQTIFNIVIMLLVAVGAGPGAVFIIVILAVVYAVFLQLPGVWRAAGMYKGPKIWSIAARIAVIIGVISIPVTIINYLKMLGM